MAQAGRLSTTSGRLLYLVSWRGGVKPMPSLFTSRAASSSCPKRPFHDDGRFDNQNNDKTSFYFTASLLSFGCLSLTLLYAKALLKKSKNMSFLETAQCSVNDTDDISRSKRFNFIAEAVEMAAPAVVNIELIHVRDTIFGRARMASCGSGFIVDEDGHVLTNAHVVQDSREVAVKFSNGRNVTGTVMFIDETTDLALIKLHLKKGEKVPYLPFGSSKNLRSGEWVIAMGSPLSLSNTITAGIVSCVHRPSCEMGLAEKPDMEYVQTDAMITKGNSGGPLVNLDGQVIGINTMSAGPGISFAIPSDIAKDFLEATKKTVQKKRGEKKYAIGVSLLTVTPDILYTLQVRNNLPPDVTHGVLLVEVWSGSTADHAGLLNGDVVIRINGMNIKRSRDIQQLVQKGQPMEFEIVRNGRRRHVTVIPTPLK